MSAHDMAARRKKRFRHATDSKHAFPIADNLLKRDFHVDCWDNAVAESFWCTIKAELIHDVDFPLRAAAEQVIFEYIEVFHHRRRRHSTIGYRTPVQQEEIYEAARQTTA